MNTTEAVRTKDDIYQVSFLLRKYGGELYADIWNIGINLSLRISDLLGIKFSDLNKEDRSLKIREQKTGKSKEIRLNNKVLSIVEKRRQQHPADEYLFTVHSNRASGVPVSRQMVSRKFKEVGETMDVALSTHSMRKSRGFAMWSDGVPIEIISKVLNHSSPAVTMVYLGITKEEVLSTYDDYEL